jgi:DNA-binding response OmpR family regulator
MGAGQALPLVAVVEPDADLREFIEALLVSAGYRCRSFVSAERFERSHAEQPVELLIADTDLPGIDGLTLARRVKESTHPVPVVLLAAEGGEDIESMARAARVSRIQRKPLQVREFLQTIAQALGMAGVV